METETETIIQPGDVVVLRTNRESMVEFVVHQRIDAKTVEVAYFYGEEGIKFSHVPDIVLKRVERLAGECRVCGEWKSQYHKLVDEQLERTRAYASEVKWYKSRIDDLSAMISTEIAPKPEFKAGDEVVHPRPCEACESFLKEIQESCLKEIQDVLDDQLDRVRKYDADIEKYRRQIDEMFALISQQQTEISNLRRELNHPDLESNVSNQILLEGKRSRV